MKIAKKPKKEKPTQREQVISELATYLNLAVIARTLIMVDGYTYEQMRDVLESYCILMEEIADGRCSVLQFIAETKEMTGCDATEEFAATPLFKAMFREYEKWAARAKRNGGLKHE